MEAITFLKVIVKVEKFSQTRYNDPTKTTVRSVTAKKKGYSFKLYYIHYRCI